MPILKILTARVFEPLLAPARTGGHGGRGSVNRIRRRKKTGWSETARTERGRCGRYREAQRTWANPRSGDREQRSPSIGRPASGFKMFTDRSKRRRRPHHLPGGAGHTRSRSNPLRVSDRIGSTGATRCARGALRCAHDHTCGNSELWASWHPAQI